MDNGKSMNWPLTFGVNMITSQNPLDEDDYAKYRDIIGSLWCPALQIEPYILVVMSLYG